MTDMVSSANLDFVIRTLGPLCEGRRDLRLWILGDGPLRTPIYELLRQEGWKHDILMPGSFESPDVVMAAADLCLVPSAWHGASWIMPTAVASGLTTVVVDSPGVRARLGNLASDFLYSHGDSTRLAELVHRGCFRRDLVSETMQRLGQELIGCADTIDRWQRVLYKVTHRLQMG